MRLIDADNLENVVLQLNKEGWAITRVEYKHLDNVIFEFPTIDAAPVRHGRWIGTEYDGYADGFPVYDAYECSVCGTEYDTDDGEITYNYCPHCGARMDGDGDE